MPDAGTMTLEAIADRLPPPSSPAGWDLPRAMLLSATFEVRKAQAVPYIPSSLMRTSPAYVRIQVVDAPDSPAGPYREAMLHLGVRDGGAIRTFLVDSVVDGAEQLAAARAAFGGSRRAGTVGVERSSDRVDVTVSTPTGEVCTIRLGALRRCDPTMLKYDPSLTAGLAPDGSPILLRGGIRVPLEEVEGTLSRDWSVEMAAGSGPWAALRPAYRITAFLAEGPMRIEAARI